MHSIKKTPNAKMVFLQIFLSFNKKFLQILAARLTRRNGKERERERSRRDLGSINLL
jgi:hypothetical protein